MSENLNLDPALSTKLESVRARCEGARRSKGWTQFGLFLLVLVLVATLVLFAVGDGFSRNLVLLGIAAAFVYGFRRFVSSIYSQPLTDEQVALFIDEHYPELQNRVVSMVALSKVARGHSNSWMIRRFLKESRQFVKGSALEYDERFRWEVRPLLQVMVLFLLIPLFIWPFSHLWTPVFLSPFVSAPSGYSVAPGDARVQMGDDVSVFVRSEVGSRAVTLQWHAGDGRWEEAPMKLGEADGVYYHIINNVDQPVSYRVVFGGEQSRTYLLTPWVTPEIEAIDLTYHYPEYLGHPEREVPNGGDISAIQETQVVIKAMPNKTLSKLELVLVSDGSRIPFRANDEGHWQGRLTIKGDDHYYLDPFDEEDIGADYKPEYKITTQEDKAPVVRVNFPFRDMEVSPLDEVGFEFNITDDFGIADYGIRYHVADREPVDVSLKPKGEPVNTSIEAQHELMLEELNLQPGDLLTWSVWARDGKPGRHEFDSFGDPYFLEMRPFKRLFREAISNGGQQPQGAGSDPLTKQKEVLIATWNLRRDARRLDDTSYQERLAIIREAQGLVGEMVDKMLSDSGSEEKPDGKALVSAVEAALDALGDAKEQAQAELHLGVAAENEQRAYRMLLRLVPPESQVGRSRGDSGSGNQQQMAGMSDLEMQRNSNSYEEEKVTREQQQATAEALNKIKDLAQRQKLLNQEIAKLISEMEQSNLDENEVKRRLERLREDARKNLEELDEVQRDIANSPMESQASQQSQKKLDQVRERMNRELEKMQPDSLQQARSAGAEALEDLDKLEDKLENQTQESAQERVANLQQKMNELREKQQRVQDTIGELGMEKDSPKLTAEDPNQTKKTQLMQQKEELAREYRELMEDAASVAEMTSGDQEHLSRKLGDWLRKTSREGIGEEMEEASSLARLGDWKELGEKETGIADKLEKAARSLDRVAGQAGGSELATQQQALQELKNLEQGAPKPGGDTNEENEEMEGLAGEKYKDWLEGLRNAQGLLGTESRFAEPLNRMRREMEKIRRNYKREDLVPKFDSFNNNVLTPLRATIVSLQKEVTALQENRQFILSDDGSIPERYRKKVAEYFQVLSETEGN